VVNVNEIVHVAGSFLFYVRNAFRHSPIEKTKDTARDRKENCPFFSCHSGNTLKAQTNDSNSTQSNLCDKILPSRLGLDRIGSHVEENYIEIIRQCCCSNNQAETVFRAVARLDFIKFRLPALVYRPQLSLLANLGGVRITEDGLPTQPAEVSSLQIVHSILCGLGHEIRRADTGIVPFEQAIKWILDLAINPPLGSGHFAEMPVGAKY
jgi:hypothetical protein